MRIAIIGCGSMGASLAFGLLRAEFSDLELVLCDHNSKKTDAIVLAAQGKNVRATKSVREAVSRADVVLLVVKPKDIKQSLIEMRDDLAISTLLVSCAAGISCDDLALWLNKRVPIARAMPNTAVAVGEGTTAIFLGPNCNKDRDLPRLETIFEKLGHVTLIQQESMMHAVAALSASAPAFVLMMLEAMGDAGVRSGLPRKDAESFAKGALNAAAALATHGVLPPADLRAQIASPGGMTIEGLYKMERSGFRGIVMDAVDAAVRKSHEMAGKKNDDQSK